MSLSRRSALALPFCFLALPAGSAQEMARRPLVPTSQYEKQGLRGWTVHVNRELLGAKAELGRRALALLEKKLEEIVRVVPTPAVTELRRVPIWLGVDAPCAEYHPSADWLREHGYNPDKARCVEIGNAARFVEWSRSQPSMVLHELAHAYHHQVLSYGPGNIRDAYRRAVETKRYESVPRNNGRRERAYALTDEKEYFAEVTEAFFGTNDFFPFTRAELEKHDPEGYQMVKSVWGLPRG